MSQILHDYFDRRPHDQQAVRRLAEHLLGQEIIELGNDVFDGPHELVEARALRHFLLKLKGPK